MNGIGAYQQTTIGTQSKGRLIVMLYDGAIKFMKLAVKELEAGDYAAKGQYINRAQDIISELNAVLDMDGGGEILSASSMPCSTWMVAERLRKTCESFTSS